MRSKKLFLLSMLACMFVLFSCKNDDDNSVDITPYAYIINEGLFGSGSGTISIYDNSTEAVTNDYFYVQNNRPLGNVVQSMTLFNNKAYIVVNNANKIEVANANDLKSTGVIEGLTSPRYFVGIDNSKGYVSQWGDNTVKVVNLTTHTITKSIPVGTGPERMIKIGNKVFVANKGGFTTDSTISVIDAATDAVVHTLTVGDNPSDMVMGKDGSLIILCMGYKSYDTLNPLETASELISINTETYAVNYREQISTTLHPEHLSINFDSTQLYYGGGSLGVPGIYVVDATEPYMPGTRLTSTYWYSFEVHPVSGKIFALDPGNYTSSGTLQILNSVGAHQKTYTVGMIPSSVVFK